MPNTAVLVHDCGDPLAATNHFRVGMAQTLEDVIECQRLRYLVFNCELGEGFDGSDRTGLDRDCFDFICDHLMVRDSATGKLAGTYRMQSGYRARGNLGYYGEEFFDCGRSKKSAARFWSLEGPVYIGSTATAMPYTCSGRELQDTR